AAKEPGRASARPARQERLSIYFAVLDRLFPSPCWCYNSKATMKLSPGLRVGAYEVLAPAGAGGMGEVYRARDTKLGREVALKVLPEGFSDDPERLARFQREARMLASLNHPNIVTIYAIEQVGPLVFIVMELVDGKTLREMLANGPLPMRDLLDISVQVATGIAKAHQMGIVHRDLKPQN